VVQFLGRGLTLPFTIIYLHEVRGFELGLAGTLMGVVAVIGMLVTAPAGALIDKYGARPVILAGLASAVAGDVVIAFATRPLITGLGLALFGVQLGVSWPAVNSLVATIVTGDLRQQYYGVSFALLNLGIGLGGVLGGLVVDVDHPWTFTAAFLLNAASFLAPVVVLLGPLRHLHGRADQPASSEPAAPSSYVAILSRPEVLVLTAIGVLLAMLGYGQIESGFPAFGRQVSEVSTHVIGFAFVVNTAVIVLLQFTVLGRVAGRRRTRVLIVMSGVWALSWALLGLTGLVPGGVTAAAGVLLFQGVFGVGETLMQSTFPALTNDLAPDHLRGRYNAVNSASFQAGTILGPVLAGFLLQHHLSAEFIVVMVAGSAAITLMALVLERRVSATVNGLRADQSWEPTGP